jgi:hypothetical protein
VPGRRHPGQAGFATKPELARRLLERALEAEVPAGWVTADEVYGNSPALRGWLEARQLPCVLAIKAIEPLSPSGLAAPAAGPPLALLVPVDHPDHAGVRLPGGGRGHRDCALVAFTGLTESTGCAGRGAAASLPGLVLATTDAKPPRGREAHGGLVAVLDSSR